MGLEIDTNNYAIINPKLKQYEKLMHEKLEAYNRVKSYIQVFEKSSQDRNSTKYKHLTNDMDTAENEYHIAEKLYCTQPGLIDYRA